MSKLVPPDELSAHDKMLIEEKFNGGNSVEVHYFDNKYIAHKGMLSKDEEYRLFLTINSLYVGTNITIDVSITGYQIESWHTNHGYNWVDPSRGRTKPRIRRWCWGSIAEKFNSKRKRKYP